jgi:ABC-2 type transport system permease protein
MNALLRAELLKLRTTRTFVALVVVALGLSLLVVGLSTALGDEWSKQDVRDLFTADFSSFFILLLGVIGMAGEWRHRTITSTFLAAPRRVRLLGAKVISYALAGALLSLIVTLVIMAEGSLILSSRGLTTIGLSDLADVLWRNLAVAAATGAIGVCIGGLVRNQVVAIVSLLVFSFAVEPAVLGVAPDVGRFGPLVGAPSGIQEVGNPVDEGEPLLSPALSLLVVSGWIALAFAATAAVLRRRDLV